jgi:hypothetical protein
MLSYIRVVTAGMSRAEGLACFLGVGRRVSGFEVCGQVKPSCSWEIRLGPSLRPRAEPRTFKAAGQPNPTLNDPIPAQFGTRVRELRERKGLRQERLADLCRLHRMCIRGIE